MRSILTLLPLALCACVPTGATDPGVVVPPGEVRVIGADATPSLVTLRMSNGDRCTAARPEGVAGNWSATTGDCGYALPVTVTYKEGGNPARYRIEAPVGALGADGVPVPRAEVYVIDVDGQRRLFVAPLAGNVRFEVQA